MERALALIVVNFASTPLLEANLVRVVDECAPDVVVVVDNFSSAGERRDVRALCDRERWTLVAPEGNLGFGGGVNRGAVAALDLGATQLLLLNPDAFIGADALARLREAVGEDLDVVAAPRILDSQGGVFFAGADVYLDDGLTRGMSRRGSRPGQPRWEWLSGACLLIPREIWQRVDGFDEDYFLYWEDVDFSRRVVRAGGQLRVVQDAVALHDEGSTHARPGGRGPAKSATYYYYNIRNRLLFATKHLDEEGMRRWRRGAWSSAREVMLRGGRRQLLRPWRPVSAAVRGVRDGRRDIATALRMQKSNATARPRD